ncbi:MAG: SLC13 family permease [Acidobacteria bacterium]|nr:MAG: SLC13 family permease [Acidobacteriota bacterium]REK10135.1 MAG: SLC13 family permease [Acidobacteriota bacterium]
MLDIVLLSITLGVVLLAFVFDRLPIDVVALSSLALLLLFDLVTPEEAISGFSNPAVITVMMMFILSYALTHSGLLNKLGQRIAALSGKSHWLASATLLMVAGVLSAFINNTAALAIFLPVGIQLARHYSFSPSRLLLPLSYISIVGGTCTLIGTSTNLLISSLAEQHGQPPFGVFEFLPLGIILFLVGSVYCFAVMPHLPERVDSASLMGRYNLTSFLTEVRVPESGSRLVGRTVLEEGISERLQLNVLEILRGNRRIASDLRRTVIEPGDVMIVRGAMQHIVRFREQYGLLLLTDVKLEDSDLSDEENILAEIQLSPSSSMTGQTLKEIDFRRRHGCFVLALNRTGEMIRDKLAQIPLRQWDTLLVFGPRERVEALLSEDDFISLQELDIRLRMPGRWWVGVAIIPIVVLLAATGVMSILKASILGVAALVLLGGLTITKAYESINWTVIFLLAMILPLGIAMENTGLAAIIGEWIGDIGENASPFIALSVIYLATALLSEIVSNNSTAVLMAPIAITTATTLGLEPKAFLMAVAYAASASFLTPMGYQTNAMVYGPGGYRFLDYVVFGAPLKIVFWLLSVLLIPVFWPLQAG